jgi:hypothetical protein
MRIRALKNGFCLVPGGLIRLILAFLLNERLNPLWHKTKPCFGGSMTHGFSLLFWQKLTIKGYFRISIG